MADGYVIKANALETDAATFGKWSTRLTGMAAAIPIDLAADDFSYIPLAQTLYQAYLASAQTVKGHIEQGAAVFTGFERTLLTTVVTYREAENLSEADVKKVQAELAGL
jgi:hypothetical protein